MGGLMDRSLGEAVGRWTSHGLLVLGWWTSGVMAWRVGGLPNRRPGGSMSCGGSVDGGTGRGRRGKKLWAGGSVSRPLGHCCNKNNFFLFQNMQSSRPPPPRFCAHPPEKLNAIQIFCDQEYAKLIGAGWPHRCLRPPPIWKIECKCNADLPPSGICDINHLIGADGPHRCLRPPTRETECSPDLPRSGICDIYHLIGAGGAHRCLRPPIREAECLRPTHRTWGVWASATSQLPKSCGCEPDRMRGPPTAIGAFDLSFAISTSRAVLEPDRVRDPPTAIGGLELRNFQRSRGCGTGPRAGAHAPQLEGLSFAICTKSWRGCGTGPPSVDCRPTVGGLQTNRRWIADRPPACNQRLNVPVPAFYFCDQEYATSII